MTLMENENAPAAENIPVLQTRVDCDEFQSYCLHNLAERTALLKRMIELKTPLHVILGARAYLSLPLAIKGKEFIVEAPQDQVLRERFTNATQVLVQTELDKIAIEFRLPQLFSYAFESCAAYRAELPDKILRLQRRETFRISTQGYNTAFCKFMLNGKALNFSLLNLSIGGMAIETTSSGEAFSIGQTIENVELFLPQTPPLLVAFQVRVLREEVVGLRKKIRLGCLFLNLNGTTEVQISRCITQLERAALRT